MFLIAAWPVPCSNDCQCHYFFEEEANVLNCSRTNLTSLTEVQILNNTMWFVARSNNISTLQWTESFKNITLFDFQNSSIQEIDTEFFIHIQTSSYVNFASNKLQSFPLSLNETSFSEVYLAGNPIDCNCDMMWFADWLNRTKPKSQIRIVQDYDKVFCEGGIWNGHPVYTLNATEMGCYPKIVAEYVCLYNRLIIK